MKYTKIFSYSAVFLLIVFLVVNKLFITESKTEIKAGERRQGPLELSARVIRYIPFENSIVVNGTIMPNEYVEISTEASGKITKIEFNEGSYVKKGDLLVKVNDSELQAQLSKAKYRKELAQEKEFRQRKLLESNSTSKELYDIALNELNTVNADIELINAQIAKTEIRAPFDGKIGLRSVSEGAYVTPGTKIASLVNVNPAKIDFLIPQKYADMIGNGTVVKISIPFKSESYTGTVYAVEPGVDAQTRTLRVRAKTPNPNGRLVAGSYVEVSVSLENISDAILVPSETIVPDIQGQFVYLYRGGKAVPNKVDIGIRTENEVQITGGLSAGDTLITSGIIQLRPGAKVTLKSVE